MASEKRFAMFAKLILVPFAVCVSIAVLCSGCDTTAEKKIESAREDLHEAKQEVKEAVKDAETAYRDEWHDFQFKTDATIRDNEYRLNELKRKMVKVVGTRKTQFDMKVEAVHQKNESLKKQLANYKDGGKKEWLEFKESIGRNMKETRKLLDTLTSEYPK